MTGENRAGRRGRFIELLPVAAALAVHAVAHGRWLVCAPAMGLLAVAAWRDWRVGYSPERLLGSGAAGLGVGAAMLWVSEPPTLPFPPALFGPLCGALVGLTLICALGQRRYYAWTYACLLAALSLRVRELPAAELVLAGMVLSVLGVGFHEAGLGRSGARAGGGFAVFFGVVVLGGVGLTRLLWLGDGLLLEAVYRLTSGVSPGAGEFQAEVDLHAVERKPRGSERALAVVSGSPERLRARVFDAFDGARWTVSRELMETRPARPPAGSEPERVMVLTLLSRVGPWLPAPAGTRGVEGTSLELQGGWVMKAEDVTGVPLVLHLGAGERLPPEEVPAGRFTALPEELAAELRPLAVELTRGAATAGERARRLEAYFQDGFEYSLNVDLRGEGSPLAVMVREKRAAYCTYFASAMAALLRSVDVPARVVGGFAPEEGNPLTGTTVVRERDAHAWVEVYLAEEGRFVAYDPTPWRSRDEVMGTGKPEGRLGQVLGAMGTYFRELGAGLRHQPLARAKAMLGSPLSWGLMVGLVGWRWRPGRRKARARGGREAMGGSDARLSAVYARYLKTLERRAGLVPRPSETDDELLVRLRAARGETVARVAEDFLAHYRDARYRGEHAAELPWAALVDTLDGALRDTRSSQGALKR